MIESVDIGRHKKSVEVRMLPPSEMGERPGVVVGGVGGRRLRRRKSVANAYAPAFSKTISTCGI